MWTPADLRLLRTLHITPGDYPPPAPRFSVEEIDSERVGMYDKRTRRLWIFTSGKFDNPRASADDVARQMNEYEGEQQRS